MRKLAMAMPQFPPALLEINVAFNNCSSKYVQRFLENKNKKKSKLLLHYEGNKVTVRAILLPSPLRDTGHTPTAPQHFKAGEYQTLVYLDSVGM